MNLLCRLDHLHGQTLLVEGREYFIGDNGLCCDLPEEHANILLDQPDTWCLVHPEDVTRPKDVIGHVGQPQGMEHLILPPGETLLLPDNVKIPADPGKVVGRPKRKKKAGQR